MKYLFIKTDTIKLTELLEKIDWSSSIMSGGILGGVALRILFGPLRCRAITDRHGGEWEALQTLRGTFKM